MRVQAEPVGAPVSPRAQSTFTPAAKVLLNVNAVRGCVSVPMVGALRAVAVCDVGGTRGRVANGVLPDAGKLARIAYLVHGVSPHRVIRRADSTSCPPP